MDLGNIGGSRVPKKAIFCGFQTFFGLFKGPEWCQTKIPGHLPPADRSLPTAEHICGFWFQGSFVQIMAHCAVSIYNLIFRNTFAIFNSDTCPNWWCSMITATPRATTTWWTSRWGGWWWTLWWWWPPRWWRTRAWSMSVSAPGTTAPWLSAGCAQFLFYLKFRKLLRE